VYCCSAPNQNAPGQPDNPGAAMQGAILWHSRLRNPTLVSVTPPHGRAHSRAVPLPFTAAIRLAREDDRDVDRPRPRTQPSHCSTTSTHRPRSSDGYVVRSSRRSGDGTVFGVTLKVTSSVVRSAHAQCRPPNF
jgi:hypothetical protein